MKNLCNVVATTTVIVSVSFSLSYGMQAMHPTTPPLQPQDQAILTKITEMQISTALQQISLLSIATQMHPFTKMAQLLKIQRTLDELRQTTPEAKLKQKIKFALASIDTLQHKILSQYPDAMLWAEAEERQKSKERAKNNTNDVSKPGEPQECIAQK
jgi:hypothetical protein